MGVRVTLVPPSLQLPSKVQGTRVTDGPLIVQCDKTLLLEVDHELAERVPARDRAVRRARARARARAHLPADAARPVERARRRPRRRAGRRRAARATAATRCRTRCWSTSPRRWPATAGCSCVKHPAHGLVLHAIDRAGARGGAALQEGRAAGRRPDRRRHRRRAPVRARPPQAGAAQARLAGRGPRRLRRRRGAPDRAASRTAGRCGPTSSEAVDGFWHGGSGVVVLPCGAGKTIVGAAAMAQAQATTLILVTNTVAARQWKRRAAQAHLADRGGDRRVLRRPQGDPAGHHRDLPGDDDPAEGRLRAPRAVRRPRLGPDRLRRGAPAAGADLPDDRRPAGPPPARPDRDAGPRGRPRGRRVLPDRPQALRRAVEGHRGAGLHRAGRLRRGPGHAAPTPSGWPTRRPSPRSATGSASTAASKTEVVERAGRSSTRASRRWSSASTSTSSTTSASGSTPR